MQVLLLYYFDEKNIPNAYIIGLSPNIVVYLQYHKYDIGSVFSCTTKIVDTFDYIIITKFPMLIYLTVSRIRHLFLQYKKYDNSNIYTYSEVRLL